MQRLAMLFLAIGLTGCIPTAESTKTDPQLPQATANTAGTANAAVILPEAAALKEAQKQWPNASLCDDGGYRIRPCEYGRR